MICYKVVSEIRGKFYSSNMSMLDRERISNLLDPSTYLQDNNFIEYKIGEWIYPKFGRIFTFQNFSEARDFCWQYYNSPYKILKCKSKGGIIGYPSSNPKNGHKYFWDMLDQLVLTAKNKRKKFNFSFDSERHFEWKSLLCLAVKPIEKC